MSDSNSTKNPWKTLNSEIKYENPWIKVEEDQVINPSGGNGIYGKVHFKNIAIGIVPIDKEGNTWLVGQHRYPLNQYSWEVPEGGCPEGEDKLDAAKRELKEEAGLSANKWEELLTMHLSNSVSDEVAIVYIATDLTEGSTHFEETEDLVIKKLPLRDAVEMVMNGEITDSISMAALLKMDKLLKSGDYQNLKSL
jgi:8-oxo-dGTP pyrophosphatase MutT (NUDIX family)